MTARKDFVQTYIEGFRRSDHAMVLGCLADDVVWEIYGHTTITGKDAFDAEIENEAFVGSGRMTPRAGDPVSFVFAEVFTFAGDLVSRLETFHINLS
jgi:uncharacterized protein